MTSRLDFWGEGSCMRWKVDLRQSQEPGKAQTVTFFFSYIILTVCQYLFAHCHPALQHVSSRKASQILSTCIHFTAPSQTCDSLTSCNYYPAEPQNLVSRTIWAKGWQNGVAEICPCLVWRKLTCLQPFITI